MNNRPSDEDLEAEAVRLRAEITTTENNIRFVINTALIPLPASNVERLTQIFQCFDQERLRIHVEVGEEMRQNGRFLEAEEELMEAHRQLELERARHENQQERVVMDQVNNLQDREYQAFNRFSAMLPEYDIGELRKFESLLENTWKKLGSYVRPNLQNQDFIDIFERNDQMELLNQLRNRYSDQE